MSGLKSHNEFDSLETFFNTRLKDASLEPTNNSWMLIEEELNKLAKEKRRRRFLWFFSSGLILVCGLASLWYFMPGKELVKSRESKIVSQKPEVAGRELKVESQKKEIIKEETSTSKEQPSEITSEKTESIAVQKIQLGAFKHEANVAAFNKIPYRVIAVKSNDGYTKYYAEANEKDALEKVQQVGFAGAFVKKDFDELQGKSIVKNEGVIETPEPVYVAANVGAKDEGQERREKKQEQRNKSKEAKQERNNSLVAVASPVKSENSAAKPTVNPEITNESVSNPTVAANNSKDTQSDKPAAKNEVPAATTKTTTKEETPTTKTETPVVAVNSEPKKEEPVKETQAPATETKTEIAAPVAVAETKKDSTPVKEEKKDSVQTPVKIAAADSSKPNPFTPVWSLSLLGGPNFFNANSQSNSVKTLNEHQQLTYNGEVKIQYRPIKFFSVSGGISYSTFTAQQDATYFRFYKFQTEDYQFHSSLGNMAVPMSTMLQGFYFNAPTDTFFSKYAYTTTVQTINIPLQANVHFLNTKWVDLSVGLGANSSYAIGQHTHFSLIKENSTVDFNYNNVTANKFNLLLMAGLSCDIRITKHWYVTLNPTYKYGVTNISPVSGTTYKPAFFSANAGVKFNF